MIVCVYVCESERETETEKSTRHSIWSCHGRLLSVLHPLDHGHLCVPSVFQGDWAGDLLCGILFLLIGAFPLTLALTWASLRNTSAPWLMLGLCPYKYIISWKYHKSNMHLIHLTYQTALLCLVRFECVYSSRICIRSSLLAYPFQWNKQSSFINCNFSVVCFV